MTRLMPFQLIKTLAIYTLLGALLSSSAWAVRIKDVTSIQGIRSNQLQGIGLVSGLAGNGDKDLDLTNQAIFNQIREYGLNINFDDVESKNMALVTLTAEIGAFAKEGDRIDVTVSAMGDAQTLQGGILLQTPLYAANGRVYAVSQGPVAVGGFIGGGGEGGGATVQKNHPTTGIISGGAIVEHPIHTTITNLGAIDFKLLNPDYTTAVRMADAINRVYPASAQAIDPATVNVYVPKAFEGQTPNFIASVGNLDVEPDIPARVIINERTGTIVATSNVRISEVAISYGALVIKVTNQDEITQPGAFSAGETARTNNQQTDVTEERGKFAVIPNAGVENPSIQDLANALNKLGVTTRDMITILQTLKKSGALHAELVIN